MSDERWRDAAIVAANRAAIFATIFTSTKTQRALGCVRRSRSCSVRSSRTIPNDQRRTPGTTTVLTRDHGAGRLRRRKSGAPKSLHPGPLGREAGLVKRAATPLPIGQHRQLMERLIGRGRERRNLYERDCNLRSTQP